MDKLISPIGTFAPMTTAALARDVPPKEGDERFVGPRHAVCRAAFGGRGWW